MRSLEELATWRRVYASIPNCQHTVTVSLKAVGGTSFDRSTGWQPRRLKTLAEIYRWPKSIAGRSLGHRE